MDSETRKMFELILNKLDGLDNRQGSFENRMESFDNRLASFENRMESFENRMGSFENRLVSMEIKQDEIYSVVKSIEHSNQVNRAEIDNLGVRTAYLEGTVEAIADAIISRRAIK